VARALRTAGTEKRVLVPSIAVESGDFIDGVTLDEVRQETGVEVKVVEVNPVILRAELDGEGC
jgi:NifB/MoaA-like Fe-S oxidoreductase